MDNLELYNQFLKTDLNTPAQREVFPSAFIGQLARLVCERDWEEALSLAKPVAQTLRPQQEATVRDVTTRRRPS